MLLNGLLFVCGFVLVCLCLLFVLDCVMLYELCFVMCVFLWLCVHSVCFVCDAACAVVCAYCVAVRLCAFLVCLMCLCALCVMYCVMMYGLLFLFAFVCMCVALVRLHVLFVMYVWC